MPPISAGTAFVDIVPDFSQFAAKVQAGVQPAAQKVASTTSAAVTKQTAGLKTKLVSIGQGVGGLVAGAAIGTAVLGFVKSSISAAEEAAKVARQTDAVLKSTGGAAGVTAQHVSDLAGSLSKVAAVDDEVIAQGENVLLTFTNIRNEVGKGNDIFDQATGLALDLSAALGQDMQSSVVQLGKALNDPIRGVTALRRVGVSFTEQQQDQIKVLVESGKTLEAQKIILAELRKEFGGAAEANATATGRMAVAFDALQETVGGLLLPLVNDLAVVLEKLAPLLTFAADNAGVLLAAFAAFATVSRLPSFLTSISGLLAKLGGAGAGGFQAAADGALALKGSLTFLTAVATGTALALNTVSEANAENQRRFNDWVVRIADGTAVVEQYEDGLNQVVQRMPEWAREQILAQFGVDKIRDAVEAYNRTQDRQARILKDVTEGGRSYREDLDRQVENVGRAAAAHRDYIDRLRAVRRVSGLVSDELRNAQGRFAGIRVAVSNTGEAIATWAGLTRRQVRRWASAVVGSASEAINAFADFTNVTKESATAAVKNAKDQVGAAKQYRDGVREIVTSDFPASIKKQVIDAGPDIVRQWAEMTDGQRDAFVKALEQTTHIMDQTKDVIVNKIGQAMDEVERETSKTIDLKTDVDTSAAQQHLKEWLEQVENTKVTIPVDAVFSVGGGVGGASTGARIPGYGGGDTVPALLEPGEWVINKDAVRHYGDSFFNRLNAMRFAGGGMVDDHGITYTLSASELRSAIIESVRHNVDRLFSIGGPSGLTPTARSYYGAIQTLFHPPIMTTGPVVRKIIGTNTWSQHCLAGDTEVLTREGPVPIAKLADLGSAEVLTRDPWRKGTDGRWVEAPFRSYGLDDVHAVNLTMWGRKKTIKATTAHRWFVRRGPRGSQRTYEVTTADLRLGDQLLNVVPRWMGRVKVSPFGIAAGLVFGDGSRHRGSRTGSFVTLWGKDRAMTRYFPPALHWSPRRLPSGVEGVTVYGFPRAFKDRPALTESTEYLAGWLAGYIAADGNVDKRDGQLTLASVRRDDLDFVRTVAMRLGIATRAPRVQRRSPGNGFAGGHEESYVLQFVMATVPEWLILHDEHRAALRTATRMACWSVESVEHSGREEVFCATVPETGAFALSDWILTGNSYGNALDITNSFASSPDAYKQSIANFLAEMGQLRRDIHYIAYNHHGWTLSSPWSAGVTSPHTNHVHADFYPQYSGTPRAHGGPVRPGHPYLVGERGPEMFVPANAGAISPNVKTASGPVAVRGRLELDIERAEAFIRGVAADVVSDELSHRGL